MSFVVTQTAYFLMIISEYLLSRVVDGGLAHLRVCSYHMQYAHGEVAAFLTYTPEY